MNGSGLLQVYAYKRKKEDETGLVKEPQILIQMCLGQPNEEL